MPDNLINRVEAVKALHDIEQMYSSIGWYLHLDEYRNLRKNLTEEDEIFLQENVNILRNHLQNQAQLISSQNLLEFACFYPGKTRSIEAPLEILKESKGGFSEKRLKEAASWLEYAEEILQQFQAFSEERIQRIIIFIDAKPNLLRHENILQIHEYIQKLEKYSILRKTQDELIRQLTSEEVNDLAQYALELWKAKPESGRNWEDTLLLNGLFCLHPDKFPPIHQQMFECGIVYPDHLYHQANRETAIAIQAKILSTTEVNFWFQHCFVWCKDVLVEQQLQAWEANPPSWWQERFEHEPLSLAAGWELTAEGKRRYLYHETCYPLVPAAGEKPNMLREDTCQWCNQKLDNCLDLDLTDARLSFLKLDGKRLVIAFCQWCHAFQDQYFDVDFEGNTHWSSYNSPEPPSRMEYDDNERNSLVLAEKPRGIFESLSLDWAQDGSSQMGGFPSWVNFERFPTCPSCKKHMPFIGQVRWWDITHDHVEGTSYAFLCADCKISLVNYDQT